MPLKGGDPNPLVEIKKDFDERVEIPEELRWLHSSNEQKRLFDHRSIVRYNIFAKCTEVLGNEA